VRQKKREEKNTDKSVANRKQGTFSVEKQKKGGQKQCTWRAKKRKGHFNKIVVEGALKREGRE